jgi:exopolysaccharide biosynthesis polyprenyl glycosylphosphotransferase
MKVKENIFKMIRIIGDIIFVNLSFFIVLKLRFGEIPPSNYNAFIKVIPYISIFSIILFYMYNLYTNQLKRRMDEIIYSFIPASFIIVLFTGAVTYLTQANAFPRSVYLLSFPSILITMIAWRYLTVVFEQKFTHTKDIIIIGKGKSTAKLIENIAYSVHRSYNIKYVLIDNKRHLKGVDYVECEKIFNLNNISAKLLNLEADILFIDSNLSEIEKKDAFHAALEKEWEVSLVPEFYEIMLSGAKLEQIGEIPVFEITPPSKSMSFAFKRLMDIVLSLLGIIISLPLTIPAALAVKLESRGPLFFTQERISYKGKKFKVYKFRTMVNNAEKHTGPVLAKDNDSRITTVGKLLRKTRIDEIPQLINVLKGEMSIIGPRPERPHFVEQFQDKMPHYKFRHHIHSGITGLAQVYGYYSTDAEDKLRMDLLYVNKRTFVLDIKILLETLKVIFMGNKSK